ncbi:hypothetical protein [Clostridium sp.]|uniref:hypothetical protein n=1 Tax=Clostridium sp. TaxID=1506 RepID=UPI00257E1980|nr:hypothetical protein [Clostridium sp.]MBD9275937.1 hypothetical protein [Clostridium sp.]
MGEIKQANFRIDSDTADAFRAFCEQKGMNQAQGFDHVMQVFELNQAKSSIPGRSVEIEEFETMVKSITSAYLYSLELNQNAEARAREEFSSELQRKELRLTELQKKVEQLQAEKKKMDAEFALLTKQEQTLTEQLESLRKGAADQEQINQMLKEKLEEAQNQLKKNEHTKESEEMLKNELLQCKQELHDTVLALSHSQKEQEVKSESYQHASDRILALETENKELQQKLTELTQELSKQKADADVGLQQCKAQAELTMERALFKKEREMQELLRQADKENARLEVLLEQAREQLKKENIDKDEQ